MGSGNAWAIVYVNSARKLIHSHLKNVMGAALLCSALVACKPASNQPPQDCAKDFSVSIDVDRIEGHNLLIAIEKLNFLFEQSSFIIDDADLVVTVKKSHHDPSEVTIDLNGIKVVRRDGKRHVDYTDILDDLDLSRHHIKVHNMFLNGGEPFESYLIRLKKNKGIIKVLLHNLNGLKIVEAKLVLKGKRFDKSNCENPPQPTAPPVEDAAAYSPHIDSADPTLSPTNLTTMTLAFSANSAGGIFWCALDGAAPSMCSSPISYSNLANGAHSFVVSATTPSGKPASSSDSHSWSVDSSPAQVTIDNIASLLSLTNNTNISFEFSSDSFNLSGFVCSLDNVGYAPCASPQNYAGLTDGIHNFSVKGLDLSGNESGNPASFQWKVDTTLPVTSIISAVPAALISNAIDKEFTFVADESANFECSFERGAYGACQSPVVLNNLSAGNHYFEVRAVDLAGNVGLSVTYSWQLDLSAPNLILGNVMPSQGTASSKDVAVEFSADEGVDFYCSWDSQPDGLCSSPFAMANVSEGPHQLNIYAIDMAGNRSADMLLSWSLDFTPPNISFGAMIPSSASFINVDNFSAVVDGADSSSSLNVSLNGVQIASSNPIVLSGLPEGNYIVDVVAVDSVGNISNALQHIFTVDMTAPILALPGSGPDLSNLDSRSISFSANEAVVYSCELDGAGFALCTSPQNYAGLADGNHNFTVTGTDAAGNSASLSQSWTVDTAAPVTSLIATQTANASFSFALSASEVGVSFVCSIDNSVFVSCGANVSYSNLAVGNHVFIAKATDLAGNLDAVGASYSFAVLAPIQTFIVSASPASLVTSSTSIAISFNASRQAANFICSFDEASPVICSSPSSYSGLSDGPHSLVVKAVDMFGDVDSVGATYSWTVDTVAPVPSNITFVIGINTIQVNWTTNEPATSTIKYGVGSLVNQSTPENMSLVTSHSMTLIGLSSNTVYSIQVTGKDQAGNAFISTPVQQVRTRRCA